MNDLLEKLNEYRSIVNYRFLYELADGTKLDFKLKQSDFPHLIGLHKLIDLPIIQRFNDPNNKTVSAKFLMQKIKQQRMITETDVKGSRYYSDIQDRYLNFTKENLLSVSYINAIVNFNASLIGSSLTSDYILFEPINGGYNHLCIAKDTVGKHYAESFFHNPGDLYIHGQTVIKVKKVEIYEANGELYLEDTFI